MLKTLLETFHIHIPSFLGGHELSEVDGEAIGVEQLESESAVDGLAASVGTHIVFEAADAVGKGFEERLLLFENDAPNQLVLFLQFGILITHLAHQSVDQLIDKRLFETEEGITVTNGTAQDAADDVAGLGVAGQLAVGNAEAHGTEVVGNNAHGHIGILTLTIGNACLGCNLLNEGLEDVGVVV